MDDDSFILAMENENRASNVVDEFIVDDETDDTAIEFADEGSLTLDDDEIVNEDNNVHGNEENVDVADTFVTPGDTKYWIPRVDDEFKLFVGHEFSSIEKAEAAYMKYAQLAGFDVRRSNEKKNRDGEILSRYLLCSREGWPEKKKIEYESSSCDRRVRKSNFKRMGCKACVKFRLKKEGKVFVVYKFEERHNHALYNFHDKLLCKSRRKLQYTDYMNVYNASTASMGGARTHTIEAAMKGGCQYVSATPTDYENVRRDMGSFVGNKDAQMLINLLAKRSGTSSYFWVDEIAKINFKEFSDTMSFDATYRTNRHAMNFVPFISIDNHQRSVVGAAALISHESIVNFKWVLKSFIEAHGKQPIFVITNQCATMKQAIPEVFTEAKHRLCMWHITKKVQNKVTLSADVNDEFKRRFNKLVWDYNTTPDAFECGWNDMVEDYSLQRNKWLKHMFDIRHCWIPSYYKDDRMSGLMRTTSRSESSHSFFWLFASFRNDLVKIYSCV